MYIILSFLIDMNPSTYSYQDPVAKLIFISIHFLYVFVENKNILAFINKPHNESISYLLTSDIINHFKHIIIL